MTPPAGLDVRVGPVDAQADAYAHVWAGAPDRTAFTHPAFLDAICGVYGRQLELATAWQDATPIAACAFVQHRLGPLRRVVVPPLTPYLAPIVTPAAVPGTVQALLAAAQERAGSAVFQPPPGADLGAYEAAGFTTLLRETHWGPLTADLVSLRAASRNVRRTLRDSTVDVRLEDGAQGAAAVGRWAAAAFTQKEEASPLVPEQVADLVARVRAAGLAQVLVAREAGAETGAVAVATDGRTAHVWAGGSAPGAAMTALVVSAMRWAHASGHTAVDLAGANLPDVAEFKRRFGVPLQTHVRAEWTGSTALRVLTGLRR